MAAHLWPSFLKSLRNVIRIMTSRHGDHTAACLKELSLTFKLLVIEKNPSVLWLKYKLNILRDSLLLFVFFQCQ